MRDLAEVAIRRHCGDAARRQRRRANTQRLLNDVELFRIDAEELDLAAYDTAFWRDVDDEGVGGHSRSALP